MQVWFASQQHPEVAPFTGGLLDGWPAWAVDALAVCRIEVGRIRRYLASVQAPRQPEVKNG